MLGYVTLGAKGDENPYELLVLSLSAFCLDIRASRYQ